MSKVMQMNRTEAEQKLKELFRLPAFYDEQWEGIARLLNGERVLMIQRTGYGKSLVFQFAATNLPGITIVFSPLIALMRDQVNKLLALDIPAAYIIHTLTPEEKANTLLKAEQGVFKILYIAPERQDDTNWIETVNRLNISMVVVDEAHCVSVWGHDFRPNYRRIVNLVNILPEHFPVLACTATATRRVQEDIERQIGKGMTVQRGSLLRPNFKLHVIHASSQEAKMLHILRLVNALPGTGIIYCGTKVETEVYSSWLQFNKIDAVFYNAGLDNESRVTIEQALMENRYKCIVATNALGMGLDKPDLRFIIHTQVPQSPLHYYQEIGRAGRDGKDTFVYLYYHPADDELPQAFIKGGRPAARAYKKVIDVLSLQPLGLHSIIKAVNMKQTQVNVILNDLIDQSIVTSYVDRGRTRYEIKYGAPGLNPKPFEELKAIKTAEFLEMKRYLNTSACRMNFLQNYLGDNSVADCMICDNDLKQVYKVKDNEVGLKRVQEFRETFFPVLEVATRTGIMIDGIAASYYGVTNVGSAIHRSKYENGGDFPDFLLRLTLKAFRKHFGNARFDMVLFVPPTESGDLVKNFAEKVARVLKFRLSDRLKKTRETQPQKVFESAIGKKDNLNDAFYLEEDVEEKDILLIDDIFDSGVTVKEIGRMLKNAGAQSVTPLTIAKTVGGR